MVEVLSVDEDVCARADYEQNGERRFTPGRSPSFNNTLGTSESNGRNDNNTQQKLGSMRLSTCFTVNLLY